MQFTLKTTNVESGEMPVIASYSISSSTKLTDLLGDERELNTAEDYLDMIARCQRKLTKIESDKNKEIQNITTNIFDNDTDHQISHEIKNRDNEVVHCEKYTYTIDTNCHTSRISRTLLDKNGKISKIIYEDYDDELFDKLTLYQELINNFDFKGDKKTTITFKRKYSYDNDGDVIFIDQEKTVRSKTEKSQQIFIY